MQPTLFCSPVLSDEHLCYQAMEQKAWAIEAIPATIVGAVAVYIAQSTTPQRFVTPGESGEDDFGPHSELPYGR